MKIMITLGTLRAAIFLQTKQFPDVMSNYINEIVVPVAWGTTSFILRNTMHGGHLETEHNVTLLLPLTVLKEFHAPITATAPPGSIEAHLDHQSGWNLDSLWATELDINPYNQDHLAISRSITSPQLLNDTSRGSQISKFVKHVSDTKLEGYPAYDVKGPGPRISDPESRINGKFFNGYFGIWLDNPISGPQYRPIRAHRVAIMLGLSTEHLSELNHMNPAQVIERPRTVPGRNGL